jgi:acetoin utilization protein AcuB
MKVKAIMIPFIDLKCISVDNTIEEALAIIDEHQLLSMPVVDKRRFVGALSKQHVFEEYFRNYTGSKEEYLARKVSELMKIKLVSVAEDTPIEEAAAMFIASKFRFIPVLSKTEELVGIVTQQAIFKEYQKLFGKDYDTFTIYSYDYKGTLAKIAETIAKHDANIKNIVIINTETMGLQEFFVRVECNDFDEVVKALTKKGFDVRLNKKRV